jgi:hypothetical protein
MFPVMSIPVVVINPFALDMATRATGVPGGAYSRRLCQLMQSIFVVIGLLVGVSNTEWMIQGRNTAT